MKGCSKWSLGATTKRNVEWGHCPSVMKLLVRARKPSLALLTVEVQGIRTLPPGGSSATQYMKCICFESSWKFSRSQEYFLPSPHIDDNQQSGKQNAMSSALALMRLSLSPVLLQSLT